jgi:uncharacterized RDD family membrane protein YckC
MSTWWYLHNNERIGPVERDELKQLLQRGPVADTTMVWKEGMEVWTPLNLVPELDGLRAMVPPPIPRQDKAKLALDYPVAGAWRRFWARLFDVWWESMLVGWCSAYVLGRYSAGFLHWITVPGSDQLFALLVMPFAFLLDALVYAVFGNTPGKALLCVVVADAGGERLSFARYLGRNAAVWVRGFAFGIPLINLFAFYRQSGRLRKSGQAAYDVDSDVYVRAGKAGLWRGSLFVLCALALILTMGALRSYERDRDREYRQVSDEKLYVWQNPLTGRNASIAATWRYAQEKSEDGQQLYTFTEINNRAVVVFAVERNTRMSLGNYVAALHEGQKTNISYKDGGRFLELDFLPSWQGSGVVIGEESNAVQTRVSQVGGDFWRVVAVQAPPYDYSNEMVAQLKRELWKTVAGNQPKTTS